MAVASRLRNAIMLSAAGLRLPPTRPELTRGRRCLGYAPAQAGRMIEDYKRLTRRARTVVEPSSTDASQLTAPSVIWRRQRSVERHVH